MSLSADKMSSSNATDSGLRIARKIVIKVWGTLLLIFFAIGTALASVPDFDEDHAFFLLEAQCAFGPRNPGSWGHTECLEFLQREMSFWADTVILQPFTYYSSDQDDTLHLTNIIGRIAPTNRARILLCAHWDTRPYADQDPNPANRDTPILGANDGASGVAILLEIARRCALNRPPVGVDIVLFDGEDYGREGVLDDYLLGSKYYAKNLPPPAPRFGILLDMVGDRDLKIPKEQGSYSLARDVVEKVWGVARELKISSFEQEVGRPVYDDHMPLNEIGIPTIDIIDFDYPAWHTLRDTPSACSAQSLDDVGRVLLQVIYTERP
jgi:glutaminyl-peptide cyclotransferase